MSMSEAFWTIKSLSDMTEAEWESLCDGCGKCCLIQLEDGRGGWDSTDIACRLFDDSTCRCTDYAQRSARVKSCVPLTPGNIGQLAWMPKTCAYRLIAEGRDLPDWHPLVTGDPDSTHKAGMSVKGLTVSERRVPERRWETRLKRWPGEG